MVSLANQRTLSNIPARHSLTMLDLTGNAWQREAGRLAQWTLERLVNRTDVYGSYLPLGIRQPGKSNNYTAPSKALRRQGLLPPRSSKITTAATIRAR